MCTVPYGEYGLTFRSVDSHIPHNHLASVLTAYQNLPDIRMDELRQAYDAALKLARTSRLTDAELLYTPSQIALACLSLASPALASAWVRSQFSSPPSSPSPPSQSSSPESAVFGILEPIKDMILTRGVLPDVEAVREVDRRLRLCKNPEKVVGSSAYQRKQDTKERKAAEKRARKAERIRRAIEDGDPFGTTLNEQDLDEDDEDDEDD
ncbi:hypothetical protein EUX98_g4 [Antrodiella citrinella]|uniref:Cyclin C-terminal domain-containing protein n=1 Tax=Antrodiella citrinella TaxID=2447956 RepID=A0A4S4N4S3_9APHY|nr:hypothetical protein EUX98_g4 [Antrodiella citrinella]